MNREIILAATYRSVKECHAVDVPSDADLGRAIAALLSGSGKRLAVETIASEIGVSRPAVQPLIEELREFGVEITGNGDIGYRVERAPDLLLPEFLAPLVSSTIFCEHIHHYFRIDSTNTLALASAARAEPEGAVFVAEQQTAGRGRGGHSWASPPANGVYMSIVLRPPLAPAEILPLAFAVALSVRDAIRSITGAEPDLRWPNDVLLNQKKLCGILAEMSAEATRIRHVVVGIGLNVNQTDFPPDLQLHATSIRIETGKPWSRVVLLAGILKELDRRYRQLRFEGAAALMRDFEAASSYVRGRAVTVEEEGGFRGITEGLDPNGFLLVRTDGGLRRVLSGGVRPLS